MSSSPRNASIPSSAGSRLLLLAVAVAVAVATVLVTLGAWSPAGLSGEALSVVTGGLGGGCCLYAATRATGAGRWSWVSFAGVLFLYAVGDVLWLAFGGAEGDPPVLSVADTLYLLALVPAVVGLVVYPVAGGGLRAWRHKLGPLTLDVAVLGAATLLASHVLVFDEVVRRGGASIDVAVYLVYPVTDVLLVCLVVALMLRSEGDPRPDVVLLGLCFATYAVADNAYALFAVRDQDIIGTAVDLGYVVAPVLLGAAALVAVARPGASRTVQRHVPGLLAPCCRTSSRASPSPSSWRWAAAPGRPVWSWPR